MDVRASDRVLWVLGGCWRDWLLGPCSRARWRTSMLGTLEMVRGVERGSSVARVGLRAGLRRAGVALVAACGLALAVSPVLMGTSAAQAQPGEGRRGMGGGPGGMMGGMMGGNNPPISQRQAERYYEMLGLTAEQKEAAATLFDAYQDAARAVQEGVREKMDDIRAEFQETRDPSVWQGMRDIMRKSRDERTKLDEGFFEDLKVVLTPEQASGIERVERAHRRESGARQGLMSGERVDLVAMVDEPDVKTALGDGRAKLSEMLTAYEDELDRALKQRDDVRAEIAESFQEIRQSGDPEKMNEMIEKGREASVRVRDINRKYARQMMDSLEGDARVAFERRFREQSFPEVYRPTRAARAIDGALGLNDLTPEQKTQVEELKASYARAMEPLNEKLAKATEENEETMTAEGMMRMFGGGPQEGPLADARRERREQMNDTVEKLRKILTPEQVERLPSGNDEGGPGGGGDGERPRRPRGGGQRGGGQPMDGV